MLPFVDISYAQGAYDMNANPDQLIMMKASGGDNGLYLDDQLDRNYANAKTAGKVPFMYHLAGNAAPITEANYFFDAVSPLTVGDGYALDLEPTNSWTVPQVQQFMNQFHSLTNTWPWLYMDISRCNDYNWVPILANCGLWIAAPSYSFDANVPINYEYIAQQGPIINGVDTDMFFGTLTQAKKYTYQGNTPPPPTTTTTTTKTTTTTTSQSTSSSTSTSSTTTDTTTSTTTLPPTPAQSWVEKLINWLKHFFGVN